MNPRTQQRIAIFVALVPALMIGAKIVWTEKHHDKRYQWRGYEWPIERKLMSEKVKLRQAVDTTHGAVTIDLRHFINAKLTDAPSSWSSDNSLAELPVGLHIYGGVPFDVQGSIQLMGGTLKHYEKTYPVRVNSIPINRECAKIHLFQGFISVTPKQLGVTVAKLVLHYEDNSTQEINIVGGKQAFDWWGPAYTTGVGPETRPPGPDTEFAWIGSNPSIRRLGFDFSLRLYRSTFDNPRSGTAIINVDYVSTATQTCPFLLGLTIE